MSERDDCRFFDTSSLKKTDGIEKRATAAFIRAELTKRFPNETVGDIRVVYFGGGHYGRKPNLLEKLWGAQTELSGLPAFYEVTIFIDTGVYQEEMIVWSPEAWNDRFAGTAGGGTGTGGRTYLTAPDNASRGWTVPYAVVNGFTAATIDAKNNRGLHDLILSKSGVFSDELYENWRLRSTHHMTVFGKAVAEILHQRPVRFAYMNGGSGGGRQCMMEVQNYPEDYDGVWAACPAINWHRFLLGGLWPVAVMNEYHHFLSVKKNRFFANAVHQAYGGEEKYYHLFEKPAFDARTLIGQKSPGGVITEKDALVMNELWAGPHRRNGSRLWFAQYPGVVNWQKVIPIGTYYYPLLPLNVIRPMFLSVRYARWITGDPTAKFRDIDFSRLEWLYDQGEKKLRNNMADSVELDAFLARGGKLMIDHGTDDPLIPVDGTINYYDKLCAHYGKEKVKEFLRLYITPGDNHGNCWGNGPGLTEKAGISALIDWVEKGIAPGALRKIRIDRKTGNLLEEGYQAPYRDLMN